ncbi:response regulator transcription factor [Streptomyces sp. NPDC047108]|uniref:response regulator transcription factor n=1 Tax=Streptomyces sp. NPDC047108 TaxID=3155025 RepID=UPI0033D90D13
MPAPTAPSQESPTRLLVVDDEATIAGLLAASLRHVGFDVTTAGTGKEALEEAQRRRPHLIVLDVMLPDLNGFELTRTLRARGLHMPVVFLTARDTTHDKIVGLGAGGDDYVTKPFSLDEVVARIRAVLRRTRGPQPQEAADPVLRFADLELDEETCDVRRAGLPVRLSPTEYKLLRYLLLNAGRVVSKAQILDEVWAYDFAGDTRIVESYISLLRRKIDTVEPQLIHTLRGFGYSLRRPA